MRRLRLWWSSVCLQVAILRLKARLRKIDRCTADLREVRLRLESRLRS